MKHKILLSLAAIAFSTAGFAQNGNVGIGTTTPNADAKLDITATNKGLLLPRVALTGTANAAPLSAHVAGMTVYNTKDTLDVSKGTYYNNGIKWIKIGDAASAWSLTGNAGTTPGTNYLGTKDSNALVFKTNATNDTNRKMTILPNGKVGIGIADPRYNLDVAGQTRIINYSTAGNSTIDNATLYLEAYNDNPVVQGAIVLSRTRGTYVAPTYPQTNDILGSINFRDAIDSRNTPWGGASIYGYAAENFSAAKKGTNIIFKTTNIGTPNESEKMRITADGFVGIGTINPSEKLDVDGNVQVGKRIIGLATGVEYGNRLFLGGINDNTDPMYMYRANTSNNHSEFRVVFSDDYGGGEDKFVIGTNPLGTASYYNTDFRPLLIVSSTGNAGIGIENPTEKFEVSGKVKGTAAIFTNLPVYATDAAADADTALPSGSLYKLTGTGRQVFIKP